MLKYTALLATAFALVIAVTPAIAAPDFDPPSTASASFEGDTFVAGNWADDNPVDVEDWPEDVFSSQVQDDLYPFANSGDYPFAPMTGGLDVDPHLLDQRFNSGKMLGDRFGAGSGDTTNKYGHKALRLSNGHVLTVALVPKLGATADPSAAAARNIGMVRYSDKGVKQKWDNAASVFVDSSRSYYVFPNKDVFNVDGSFTEIHDVKEYKGYIYILATRRVSATDTDLRIVRLSLTASAWAWNEVLSWTGTKERGVGLHIYKDGSVDKLTVVGSKSVSSTKTETWMAGYDIPASGLLTLDTTFGVNGTKDATWCDSCTPRAITGSTSPGVIYIAGDYDHTTTIRDGYVTKHDKKGYRFASFGTDGIRKFNFDIATPFQDRVIGIVVDPTSNKMFVLASTTDTCNTTSAGIIRLDRTTGYWDGTLLFGGGGDPGCTLTNSITPRAMALNGKRLAIAGVSTRNNAFFNPPIVGGPSLTIVDKDKGTVTDSRLFKSSGVDIGVTGAGSAFVSVVKSEADSFYAVGTLKDAVHNQKALPMTARIRADRIFGNGMEK